MSFLGIDTSNYTTSIAAISEDGVRSEARLLPVRPGELGLRQSDALFAHIKSLPDLADRLFSNLDAGAVQALGVSTRPRAVEGSYMPCFLAGVSQARVLSAALHIPMYEFSHQEGHIAAVCYGAGRPELMDKPFLAWHLSGGTTELLYVEPQGRSVSAQKIGGTTDISAGQLIDRTGQMLKLPFPAGKELDRLSRASLGGAFFKVKCSGTEFSFSGVENKIQGFYHQGAEESAVAAYAVKSVVWAVEAATENALRKYPGLPVVFSGGVSSNTALRETMEKLGAVFAPPEYSRDNAYGIACLTKRIWEG